MKYQDLENGAMRELTAEEVCAMYHFHDEYAELGLGAIEYYKGLSARDKQYIKDMTAAIMKAAQQSAQRIGCTCGAQHYPDEKYCDLCGLLIAQPANR